MATTTPSGRTLPSWLTLTAQIAAPITLVTTLLFYFGYVFTRSQYAYFGVDVDTIGLTPRDFVPYESANYEAQQPALYYAIAAPLAGGSAAGELRRLRLLSALFALYSLVAKLFLGHSPQGFTALILVITFLSGVQLLFLGVIGEYLGRVYEEVKQRPVYVVGEILGGPLVWAPGVAGAGPPLALSARW